MSIFEQRYSDPPGGTAASAGPRLGFFGAFEAAYDAQVRAWSVLGLHRSFAEIEQEQLKLIRERTGSVPDALRFARRSGQAFGEFARWFEHGGSPEIADDIAARDKVIEGLKGQIPELRTYREMWDEVRGRAHRAEEGWEDRSTTWPGMAGGFLGGAAAAVDPRTDPFNALSLGVAPGASTVLRRLGAASGSNAAAEAINQLTGVQANRELLGLDHSIRQAMEQVLFAGTVGGGIQGGAELFSAGVRRLRANIRHEPGTGFDLVGEPYGPFSPSRPPGVSDRAAFAGPRSPAALNDLHISQLWPDSRAFMDEVRAPWAETRLGRGRMDAELNQTILHMQRFDADVPPRTATALHQPVTRADVDAPWFIRPEGEVANELARHYDPELFRQLDKIDGQIAEARGRAEQLRQVQTTPRAREVEAALDQVQELQRRIEDLSRRAGDKRYRQRQAQFEIDKLNAQQKRILDRIKDDAEQLSSAQLEMVSVAERISLLQRRQDEMQPLKRHAEDVARGEMAVQMPPTDVLMLFDRLAAYGVDISPRVARIAGEMAGATPAMRATPDEMRPAMRATPGETPAETIVRTTREAAEETDDGTALIQRARKTLAEAEEAAAKGVQGEEPTIDLGYGPMKLSDEVIVGTTVDDSGRMVAQTRTWRQILNDIDDDEAMVRAMNTCAKE